MKWGTPMTQETPYGNHINLTHSHNCSVKKGAEQPCLSHVYSRKNVDWTRQLSRLGEVFDGVHKNANLHGWWRLPNRQSGYPKNVIGNVFLGDMIHVEKGSPILGHLTMVVIILKLQDQSI